MQAYVARAFLVLISLAPFIRSNSLVARQDTSSLPDCARSCYQQAVNDTSLRGDCADTDVKCLCGKDSLRSHVLECTVKGCGLPDQSKATTWYTKACASTSWDAMKAWNKNASEAAANITSDVRAGVASASSAARAAASGDAPTLDRSIYLMLLSVGICIATGIAMVLTA